MNKLQIVDKREVLGKSFTIYGTVDEPLFLARDVAEWIEHSQADVMIRTVDDGEKLTLTLFSSGQNREMWFLTEDGLYEVLMQSRKPIAKEFKKKVKEILRSIRKHGGYIANQEKLTPEQLMAKALIVAQSVIEEKDKLLEEQKPKVLFAEALEVSKSSILVGELAKLLKQNGVNIGQNRLFDWLRTNGFLMTRGESRNMPTQYSMDRGLFEIKVRTINNPDGSLRETKTPKVTGKGQIYFVNRLMQEKEVALG